MPGIARVTEGEATEQVENVLIQPQGGRACVESDASQTQRLWVAIVQVGVHSVDSKAPSQIQKRQKEKKTQPLKHPHLQNKLKGTTYVCVCVCKRQTSEGDQ